MNKVVLYVAGVNGFEWKYPDQVILVRYIIRRSGTFKRVEPRIYFVSCVKQETKFFCFLYVKACRLGGKLIKRRDHRWASYHMSIKKSR